MTSFIDRFRSAYGVEPICSVLPIAPSTYYEHVRRNAHPETAPPRVQRDAELMKEIKRVFEENGQVYGVRQVWRQMLREGLRVARCTVARLQRKIGLSGVIRGKRLKTTVSDKAAPCPLDHVNREFRVERPNLLWVSDFTCVATSSRSDAPHRRQTNSVGMRERQLQIQLPEQARTVHSIRTYDPSGIEAYWHRRFDAKRKNDEWFELSAQDLAAFRRRKFM